MKISPLQYAVQKEYTIPYLPHAFYVTLCLLLCIVIPVNIALVGSDVVTILKTDPTIVDNPWWMPGSWPDFLRPSIPQKCQPASITDDMNLRTNSSMPIFKYVLQRAYANKEVQLDPTNRIYPAPYLANKLSNCEVRTITLRMKIPAVTMKYQAKIYCTLEKDRSSDFEIPDEVVFTMTYNRADNPDLAPDDMFDYITSAVIPEPRNTSGRPQLIQSPLENLPIDPSSSNNVLAVLDGMYYDLSRAMWAQIGIWRWANNTVRYSTYVTEWIARTGDYCRSESMGFATCGNLTDIGRWLYFYGAPDDYYGEENAIVPFNITGTNSVIALRDAIMIDLGNAQASSNIYLNKTYFNEAIRIDPFHAEAASILTNLPGDDRINSSDYWRFCSAWACINTPWAEAFRYITDNKPLKNIVLPYQPNGTQAPSVLSFKYLCPTFRRKSTNALLVSVFVATATIMTSIYALFEWYMPKAEARYQKRQQASAQAINRDIEDQADEEHQFDGIPITGMNTFDTPYNPVPRIEKDKELLVIGS
ncbi:hypothetical protein ACGC1H_003011 [Rhizoctonia solani]